MRPTPLLAAALLALTPVAFAQSSGPTIGQQADRTFDRAEDATRRTVNPPPGEPTVGQKAEGVFDRAENATRRTVNPPPGEPSIGRKADGLFDRMENAIGRGVDRVRDPNDPNRMGNMPANR